LSFKSIEEVQSEKRRPEELQFTGWIRYPDNTSRRSHRGNLVCHHTLFSE